MSRGFWLDVSGNFACFTRPEMKVERVSYDVITPSATRGILEAILWKPAISWAIRRIEILNPIHWISLRRNEIAKIATTQSDGSGIMIENDRQQRAGLFLRDVRYRIQAEFIFIPPEKRKLVRQVPLKMDYLFETDFEEYTDFRKNNDVDPNEIREDETEAKYAAMFERRAKKGQYFHKPCLGCREFAADVKLVQPDQEPVTPIDESRDLGWMLYDMDYSDLNNIKPLFFRAEMKKGIINVPDRSSNLVKG
jgi:CRISPR-associated protein Cas5d